MCRDQAQVPGVDIPFRQLGSGPGDFPLPGHQDRNDAPAAATSAVVTRSWRRPICSSAMGDFCLIHDGVRY